VGRPGLLNEQRLRELVRVEREMFGPMVKLDAEFSNNCHLTFSSTLTIYILHCKYFFSLQVAVILFCKETYFTHLVQVMIKNVKCRIGLLF